MNGSRLWTAGVLLALAMLANAGIDQASAQVVIGGGGWSGPGGGWSSWGISAGVGPGVGAWGMPMGGPRYGAGWVEPVPVLRPAVFPPFGHYHAPTMVMPAPVVVRPAPVMIHHAPVIVRPSMAPPHHGHGHRRGYHGW